MLLNKELVFFRLCVIRTRVVLDLAATELVIQGLYQIFRLF